MVGYLENSCKLTNIAFYFRLFTYRHMFTFSPLRRYSNHPRRVKENEIILLMEQTILSYYQIQKFMKWFFETMFWREQLRVLYVYCVCTNTKIHHTQNQIRIEIVTLYQKKKKILIIPTIRENIWYKPNILEIVHKQIINLRCKLIP